jgi:hypothetical protein
MGFMRMGFGGLREVLWLRWRCKKEDGGIGMGFRWMGLCTAEGDICGKMDKLTGQWREL